MHYTRLESLLGCPVLHHVQLATCSTPVLSLKVKISESNLQSVISAGKKGGCFVAQWDDKRSRSRCSDVDVSPSGVSMTGTKSKVGVKITCWNCRGLLSSLPYLNSLLDPEEGPKIVVLSENWLRPYDLHQLNDLNSDYCAVGKSDSRLNEDRSGRRGCGGIGILWHKGIAASPISSTGSDRTCGIRFSLADTILPVIGVYLPCLDEGIHCYTDHLIERSVLSGTHSCWALW